VYTGSFCFGGAAVVRVSTFRTSGSRVRSFITCSAARTCGVLRRGCLHCRSSRRCCVR
jgi:hypothetical protein